MSNSGNTVGIAVNIDKHTVAGDGIAACQKDVCIIGKQGRFALVGIVVPVNERIISVLQRIHEADFMHAHTTAHRCSASLRNQRQGD